MGSIFFFIIVSLAYTVRSEEHIVSTSEEQYLIFTLRDLLYHYTDDLYKFVKTHYSDKYDPIEDDNTTAISDSDDEQNRVTTEATTVENKYASFEECRSWWNNTRYNTATQTERRTERRTKRRTEQRTERRTERFVFCVLNDKYDGLEL